MGGMEEIVCPDVVVMAGTEETALLAKVAMEGMGVAASTVLEGTVAMEVMALKEGEKEALVAPGLKEMDRMETMEELHNQD